jgi:hypothetical protein
MAFGKVDKYVVVVHGKQAPTDEEWNAYMDFNARHFLPGQEMRLLVVTDGGAPTASQRMVLNERLSAHRREDPKSFLTAIITASTLVRGVATAISWFHPVVRAFSDTNLGDAFQYLGVPSNYHDEIRRTIKGLKAELLQPAGLKPPKPGPPP